jgi:serine/threonine-protein kinase
MNEPVQRTFRLPEPGEVIQGHCSYEIGQKIGSGHFGEVYACKDEWGNDLVAKVLQPRGSYEDVKVAWNQELQKLLALRHPTITFLHDAFEYRDTFYLVLERCLTDLNALLGVPEYDGTFWMPHVARDLLQGIHFIHTAGYVHKDIHPGNVFVKSITDRMSPEKDPVYCFKIGDLGIARLETDVNAFGTLLAQWMLPPECIDQQSFGTLNRTVDIYHAGLLLLGVLLGEFPAFSRDEIVAGAPRELAESRGGKYASALSHALRRHVDARTQTAREFWREIQSASLAA